MQSKKILLVEDNANDIELTLAALDACDLATEAAVTRDGAEALDYLFRRGMFSSRTPQNPVLVLLDLKMPKVSGLDVLRQIRSDPVLRMIPVVVLSASREEPDLVEAYRLNVNAYVVKPVAFEKFIDVVKQLSLFWLLTNEPPPMQGPRP
ncbi:MAG: response regulator [Candidatus Binatia bacterium]